MNTVHLIDGSYAFKTHFQKQMVFLKKRKNDIHVNWHCVLSTGLY